MKTLIKNNKKEMHVLALFYLLTGLILCLFNVHLLTIFIRCIGVLLLLYGLYQMYRYFIQRLNTSILPLFIGIPFLLIGFLFLYKPQLLIQTISIYTGILLLLNGIIHFQTSLVEKDLGFLKWKWGLFYSILLFALGLALLFSPLSTVGKILKVCGALLCIIGLGLLISAWRIGRLTKTEDNYIEGDFKDL